MPAEGLVRTASKFRPEETISRLKSEIASHGLSLFAAVDHAKNAQEVGLSLRPTTVLIFGNAKGGTPLMQANQTAGIDLPLKALVWQDDAGKTWISYNDPVWIAHRHGLDAQADDLALPLRRGLETVVRSAAGE